MKTKTNRYPGLYREVTGQGGMRFRIVINHKKNIIQEYFSFRDAASEAKAKKAALGRWRELRKVYPVITKRRFREIPRIVSGTGMIGVSRITSIVKGYEYEFWKATWTTLQGKRKSQQFSIKKYGSREAKRLAVAARLAALDKIGPA